MPNHQKITFTIYEDENVISTVEHTDVHNEETRIHPIFNLLHSQTIDFMRFLHSWDAWRTHLLQTRSSYTEMALEERRQRLLSIEKCQHLTLSEPFTWMNDLWQECLNCGHMDSPSWFQARSLNED